MQQTLNPAYNSHIVNLAYLNSSDDAVQLQQQGRDYDYIDELTNTSQ